MLLEGWSIPQQFSFVNTPLIPQMSGIYAFLDDNNNFVYIGETGNLSRRYAEYVNGCNPCVNSRARKFVYSLESHEMKRKVLEKSLIEKIRPVCNIEFNR